MRKRPRFSASDLKFIHRQLGMVGTVSTGDSSEPRKPRQRRSPPGFNYVPARPARLRLPPNTRAYRDRLVRNLLNEIALGTSTTKLYASLLVRELLGYSRDRKMLRALYAEHLNEVGYDHPVSAPDHSAGRVRTRP